MRTAVQLYTLRSLDATLLELIDVVAAAGYDGVEFAGLGDAGPEEIASALDTSGLTAAGAHVGVERLEADPVGTSREYRSIGCDTLVVPYLDEAHFVDSSAVEETSQRLSDLAERLGKCDTRLGYHNHDHEFQALAVTNAYERLVDSSSASLTFEFDVGWATAAGMDPVELLERFGDRMPLVHIKDVDAETKEPVDLGEGDVDVEACISAARRCDVEWLIFEHDHPTDPVATVEAAGEYLAGTE